MKIKVAVTMTMDVDQETKEFYQDLMNDGLMEDFIKETALAEEGEIVLEDVANNPEEQMVISHVSESGLVCESILQKNLTSYVKKHKLQPWEYKVIKGEIVR